MPRDALPDAEALKFAQQELMVPDNLAAALSGVAVSTVMNHRNKGNWEIGGNLADDDPRKMSVKVFKGDDGVWAFVDEPDKTPEPEPAAYEPSEEEFIGSVRKSWRNILADTAALVASGKLGLVQKRSLDRLDLAMKSFEKLVRLTGIDVSQFSGGQGAETKLSEDELRDVLNKIGGRIDELAQQRLKELVAGKVRSAADAGINAGMDAERQDEPDTL